jgi:hypothetical protein
MDIQYDLKIEKAIYGEDAKTFEIDDEISIADSDYHQNKVFYIVVKIDENFIYVKRLIPMTIVAEK